MSYNKHTWVNNVDAVDEDKMNNIENGIANAVEKTGDTMTGELVFNNPSEYAAITKKRTNNNVDYTMVLGVGGTGVVRLERREGTAGSGQSLEVRNDGLYSGASGKKLVEQSTNWSEATLSSGLEGKIRYAQIGNVVIVNFIDFIIRKNIASYGEVLATGLPKSSIYLVSALSNYDYPSTPMRIGITNDGSIQTHYSNTIQVGSGFYGTIVYITNQ